MPRTTWVKLGPSLEFFLIVIFHSWHIETKKIWLKSMLRSRLLWEPPKSYDVLRQIFRKFAAHDGILVVIWQVFAIGRLNIDLSKLKRKLVTQNFLVNWQHENFGGKFAWLSNFTGSTSADVMIQSSRRLVKTIDQSDIRIKKNAIKNF